MKSLTIFIFCVVAGCSGYGPVYHESEPAVTHIYAAPFYEPYHEGIYETAKTIQTFQHLGDLDLP